MPRCTLCKKTALVPMICKCEKTYCIAHRQPEIHSCTFDYQAEHKARITEQNPVVVAPKVLYV